MVLSRYAAAARYRASTRDGEGVQMMLDAVRGYWALASGLTEVSRQKATAAARALVGQGEATAEQVTAIVEDLLSTSMSNRAALANIVRLEVDRARSAMGLVTSAELESLTGRVTALQSQVAALHESASEPPAWKPTSGAKPAEPATARKTAAKQTAAKAAGAAAQASPPVAANARGESSTTSATTATTPSETSRTTAAARTAAKATAAESTPPAGTGSRGSKRVATSEAAKKLAAVSTAAKKIPAKKTPAKKTAATKTAAKKASATKTSGTKTSGTKTLAKKAARRATGGSSAGSN
ncbi:MAG: hypothetical protein H0V10_05795 [Geodermatophilaceae bacterium]|nr:hypothetical protein [Geodermatophilaceae bacterium]